MVLVVNIVIISPKSYIDDDNVEDENNYSNDEDEDIYVTVCQHLFVSNVTRSHNPYPVA